MSLSTTRDFPIIDAHSHIGDILNPNGGKLIGMTGIPDRNISDRPVRASDLKDPAFYAGLFGFNHKGKQMPEFLGTWNIAYSTKRNAAATLENFEKSMVGSWVDISVCLPIPPYVTFDDVNDAKQKNSRIVAFTGVDFKLFSHSNSIFREYVRHQLFQDVAAGAKWLKIHPILQMVPFVSERVRIVVEEFEQYDLPVLFHAGKAGYYRSKADLSRQAIEHGLDIDGARKLAKDYPTVPFIAGHSGISLVDEVMEKLSGLDNVSVDTSFQPDYKIRELIQKFGRDRVMFASDWPYGARKKHIEVMKRACNGDTTLESKVFFENANRIMKLGIY